VTCNSCQVTSGPLCGYTLYSCNCQTCTTYYYYLRLSSCISGTISAAVVSDVALSQAAAAIKVVTNENNIVATAYSDTTLVSSLGSINTTPASPIKAPKAGIIKTPSSYNQSSTIDNFAAEG
jgi:hypothetical protein